MGNVMLASCMSCGSVASGVTTGEVFPMAQSILRQAFEKLTQQHPHSRPRLQVKDTDKKLTKPEWHMLGPTFQAAIGNASGEFSVEVYERDGNTRLAFFQHADPDPHVNTRVCFLWCRGTTLSGYESDIDDPDSQVAAFVYSHLWHIIGELRQQHAHARRTSAALTGSFGIYNG